MKKNLLALGVGLAVMAGGHQAMAVDEIRINGFLTAAATYTDAESSYNVELADKDAKFDGRDNRLGLQISADINDRMGFTAQLLARAVPDNFNTEADWAFVSYDINNDVQVRAGKVKLPTFLTSDYIEVGYAYPWVRPPQEVYSLSPITSLSGIDILWTVPVGDSTLLIQPYYGNSSGTGFVTGMQAPYINQAISDNGGTPFIQPGDEVEFEAKGLGGINLALATEIGTFRVGYLTTDVSSDFSAGPIDEDKATFVSAGMNIDYNNFVGYAEWASRDEEDAAELGFPDQEAWYVTAGYRFGPWLPSITYASLEEGSPDDPAVLLFSQKQKSITFGIRYELAAGAALKFEATHVDPDKDNIGLYDNGLTAATVQDPTLGALGGTGWAGTDETGNVYSVSLDVIF